MRAVENVATSTGNCYMTKSDRLAHVERVVRDKLFGYSEQQIKQELEKEAQKWEESRGKYSSWAKVQR